MTIATGSGIDRRGMAALAAGHMLADVCQGAVPALLPFLVEQRGYTYAAAAALVAAMAGSSSIVQPLFGLYSDRLGLPWLVPGGVLVAGAGIALACLADSYALMFAAVTVSGLGVAAFHPEGSRFASYLSGERRATGMSYFSVGGNLGFALGPVVVTPLVLLLGIEGAALIAVPTTIVAVLLARELPRLRSFHPAAGVASGGHGDPDDDWSAFARLAGVVASRTFVYFGLVTFLPLYYVAVLDTSEAEATTALALLLLGGVAGTLVGGPLADRFGRRTVVLGSLALLPPQILLFHAADQVLATAMAVVIGATAIATFGVTLTMGQELLPGRIGVASGVILGLAIGLGGVAAPLLGVLADSVGLSTLMYVVAALPLPGILLALTLPRRLAPAGVR